MCFVVRLKKIKTAKCYCGCWCWSWLWGSSNGQSPKSAVCDTKTRKPVWMCWFLCLSTETPMLEFGHVVPGHVSLLPLYNHTFKLQTCKPVLCTSSTVRHRAPCESAVYPKGSGWAWVVYPIGSSLMLHVSTFLVCFVFFISTTWFCLSKKVIIVKTVKVTTVKTGVIPQGSWVLH